ncbi:DUF2141 domain-containing protein [Runella sp. MFBS21]|uniref:DUF2141 domain-containing protein n=1 Tax=Runella sp. MFBS21 TaxID=3034018 RepID=UPI0023F78469|nr:DUF2141 domain-containing protein [Runella sp. MFBS21]MDF7819783.1 DUF2141 domain-containing protein [Runella sp. MFBS21]
MESLFLSLLSTLLFSTNETKLTLEISNIRHTTGTLRVGVFREGSTFGSTYTKPDFGQMVPVGGKKEERTVMSLPPGRYALALYHDTNDNWKLDKNFVGYPKEPFGFSNNYRPIFTGPKFEDCAFEVKDNGSSVLKIKLLN